MIRRTLNFALVAAIAVMPAIGLVQANPAPTVAPISGPWEAGPFTFVKREKKTRRSLSGIACSKAMAPGTSCLVVFDEGKEIRFITLKVDGYEIDNRQIVLGALDGELDAEGAAADGEYFYVVGSHSAKRSSCESNPESRQVIRFVIDASTGKAAGGTSPQGYQQTSALWAIMASLPQLKDHVGEKMCLGTEPPEKDPSLSGKKGVNIEGLAALGNRLFLGFRGPAEKGMVPILSVVSGALFDGNDPKPMVVMARVGDGRGIRDMTVMDGQIVLLVGPDDDAKNSGLGWSVMLWSGNEAEVAILKELAVLDLTSVVLRSCDDELKPEAMVAKRVNSSVELLIMSDGMCDGGPLKFLVPFEK